MARFVANTAFDALAFVNLTTLISTALTGGGKLSAMSKTGFTLTVGDSVLTVTGTDIKFSNVLGFKFPSSGTVTGAVLSDKSGTLYSLTELNLAVVDLINPTVITPSNIFHGNDTLIGSAKGDTLNGFAGDDTVQGGAGKDKLDGGGFGGTDTVDYTDKTAGISVTLSMTASSKVKVGGVVEDTIQNFANVNGGAGDDVINGDGRENKIYGNNGNDKLFGAAGYDQINGGAGDDICKSGASDPFAGDVMVGGHGSDTADYSDMTGAISVNLGVKDTLSNFWNEVRLDGLFTEWIAEFENVTGGSGDDSLTGDGGRNILKGNGGNDVLDGAAGLDLASFEDKTTDLTISLKNGAEVLVVVSATETDRLLNIEDLAGGKGADKFTGDGFANRFYGRDGDDILKGEGGDDMLIGGKGNDELSGSVGKDKFVFDSSSASSGFDTINDFKLSDGDKILLTKTAFKALGSSVTAEEFLSGKGSNLKAQTEDQHLIYNTVTGELFYDADGSGTGAAVKIAVLLTSPDGLAFSNFDMIA